MALVAAFVVALAVLVPGVGTPGLTEPHERNVADRAAPPVAPQPAKRAPAPVPEADCLRAAPEDAAARSLTPRAVAWGRDTIDDSDAGRRLPLVVLGLITVLAAAGIAMRLGGARAGVIAAVVLVSMPLLTLQARMLTSEIGTACGATLLVYGLVALSRLGAGAGLALAALDAAISIAALVIGGYVGFYGGGALLGLVVPIGAFAAAGGLGVPVVTAALRRERALPHLPALLATLAAAGLVGVLAHQLYQLTDPTPGMLPAARELFGRAIVADGCWSPALGGLWRPDDDLRMIFDSTFEQIAYGTFPWGILAPIAMVALLRSDDAGARAGGAITLAWGAGAWIAAEAFARKVGFNVYAGFPALAIAIGIWLDRVLARRARGGRDELPGGMMLVGLVFVLAAINFGKDMHAFPDRVTSLLIGSEQLKYPTASRLLLPTKTWILALGAIVAAGFGAATLGWRAAPEAPPRQHRLIAWGVAIALAASVAMGAFWAFVWQPQLALHLSSKAMFETYRALRAPGDQLVVMGDVGHAARAYAPGAEPEQVASREQVVKALSREGRVFAIAPQTELCTLHREIGGHPYYVVDDRNVRNLLLSNKLDGATDKNPLAVAIVHGEPANISQRPKTPVIWDRRLQLLGWSVPARMTRGAHYEITLYYKVLQPVGGAWKALMHFDGPLRFNGDHDPIRGRCPTSTWQPGDYIIDRHTVRAGGGAFPRGRYDVWVGFFTGSAPNWKNMPVSEAAPEMRDGTDRVKITSITLD